MANPTTVDDPWRSGATPTREDTWATFLGTGFVVLLVAGTWIYGAFSSSSPKLEIVASAAIDSSRSWRVGGRVLDRSTGKPARAYVWIVITDNGGNRYTPRGVR